MAKLVKIFSREYSVQYTEVAIRSLSVEAKTHLPALVTSQTYVPEDGNESCYVDPDEWERFLNSLYRKYQNQKNLNSFFAKFHHYGQRYISTAKQIGKFSLKKASNAKLAYLYRKYQTVLLEYSAYLWMGFFLAQGPQIARAKDIIDRRAVSDPNISTALLRPSKLSSILSLQQHLGELKLKKHKLGKNERGRILKRYAWLPCLDIHNDPWTSRDLDNFFSDLKPVAEQMTYLKAAKLANLSKNEMQVFKTARELIYVKDMRDEYRRRGIYNILPLFNAMAERLGVRRKDLAFFSYSEIVNAIETGSKLDRDEAHARRRGFLIYIKKQQSVVISSLAEIKFFVDRHVKSVRSNADQVKGLVAMKGNARGRIKTVFGVRDIAKVKSGDIMVSITTHPDYISAMHRAAAIVTDEGGLTSHAAIVSRELRIPCIVGTRIGTRIFKDGDLVEVDAQKGIVRKL